MRVTGGSVGIPPVGTVGYVQFRLSVTGDY